LGIHGFVADFGNRAIGHNARIEKNVMNELLEDVPLTVAKIRLIPWAEHFLRVLIVNSEIVLSYLNRVSSKSTTIAFVIIVV
jgi:hypothetical protein